jgi:hypothetical protein
MSEVVISYARSHPLRIGFSGGIYGTQMQLYIRYHRGQHRPPGPELTNSTGFTGLNRNGTSPMRLVLLLSPRFISDLYSYDGL